MYLAKLDPKVLLDFEEEKNENGEKSVNKHPFSTILEEKRKKNHYQTTIPNISDRYPKQTNFFLA